MPIRPQTAFDVTASRTGDRVFLHVVNANRTRSVKARFGVDGMTITGGRVHWFALEPELELFDYRPEQALPQAIELRADQEWVFPAASVSAVELQVESA